MRLGDHLATAQHFFENIGYWRFASFASPQHFSRGEEIQKIARLVLGAFVILSAYDLVFHSLSFKVKVIAHSVLFISIGSLCLSLLLSKIQKFFKLLIHEKIVPDQPQFRLDTPMPSKLPQNMTPASNKYFQGLTPVKCDLLPLFEQAALQKDDLQNGLGEEIVET